MSGVSQNLGSMIARYRRVQRLSGEELAERAGTGLTRSMVANLENGRKQDLTVSQLCAVAFVLGVSPADLLFDLTDPYAYHGIMSRPEGEVQAAAWLARGWFGGERTTREIEPRIDGVHVVGAPMSNTQSWLIERSLQERDRTLYALTAHEERLGQLRGTEPLDEQLAHLGSDEDQIAERIKSFKAELYEIERALRAYNVNLNRPAVHAGVPF